MHFAFSLQRKYLYFSVVLCKTNKQNKNKRNRRERKGKEEKLKAGVIVIGKLTNIPHRVEKKIPYK